MKSEIPTKVKQVGTDTTASHTHSKEKNEQTAKCRTISQIKQTNAIQNHIDTTAEDVRLFPNRRNSSTTPAEFFSLHNFIDLKKAFGGVWHVMSKFDIEEGINRCSHRRIVLELSEQFYEMWETFFTQPSRADLGKGRPVSCLCPARAPVYIQCI